MSTPTVQTWIRKHPLQAAIRWIGILFSCALAGMVAGAVAFAPLHLPTPVAIAVALVAGLLYAALWRRQQIASLRGPRSTARRWGWGLSLAPLIVIIAVAGLALVQLYNMGQFQPLTQDRLANFDRLTRAIDAAYPYFDEKEIDWRALVARYRPQVEAAQNDEAYFAAIAALLAEMNDGHTQLRQPYPQVIPLGKLVEIQGQAVIQMLGPTAQAAGLTVGDVVLSINGWSVDEAIAALPPQLRFGSTPWNRMDVALTNVLALLDPTETLAVTVHTRTGEERTVILRLSEPSTQPPPAAADAPLVWGERLPSGLGYIHLGRNFNNRSGHDMVAEFDAALAELMDTPGLILDLRDNGGGSSTIANQIAGRFLSEPFNYGREYYPQPLPTRAWWRWGDRRVEPRPPRYTARVVLLTNASTVSSAEEFVVSLVDNGRAATVGRQTAGSTGNPIGFQLPGGGEARFSTGNLRRAGGTPIEGIGIAPDVLVAWTIEDLRQGLDPDVTAAEQLLLE